MIFKEFVFACLGGTLLFGLVVGVGSALKSNQSSPITNVLRIGSVVSGLDDQISSSRGSTLVIASSASCPYSRRNIEFHRSLLMGAASAGLRTIMIVPDKQSADFAHRELSVPVQNVITTDLRSMNISGTPTVIVLDSEHRVLHMWSGELPPRLQHQVLSQVVSSHHLLSEPDNSEVVEIGSNASSDVRPKKSSGQLVAELSDTQLKSRLKNANLLDLSTRDAFRNMGRPGATNIPWDEISVRAKFELDKSLDWIIDCSQVEAAACDLSVYFLQKGGFNSLLVLDRGAVGAFCQTTPPKTSFWGLHAKSSAE
jgi:hypothetical protein